MKSAFYRVRTQWGNGKTGLMCLIMIGWILGVLVYSHSLGNQIRYPDEKDYMDLAGHLLNTGHYTLDGTSPSAYRAPGYPALLASLTSSGASPFLVRIVQFILLGLSVLLTFTITRHISREAAIPAALFALFYPVGIYTAGTFFPQTLATTLFLGVIYMAFCRSFSLMTSLICGALCASLLLTVPSFLFSLGVVFVAMLFHIDRSHRKNILITLLSCLLLTIPWTLRNYAVSHRFIFVASNSGINLLLGNSPNTTPNAGVNVDISAYEEKTVGMNEFERDAFYTSSAVEYVKQNKLKAMSLYFRKVLNHFNYHNVLNTRSESSNMKDLLSLLSYGLLIGLVLLRLLMHRQWAMTNFEKFVVGLYLLNGLYAAVFFTRLRFRVPYDYLLIVVAAITLRHAWAGWRESRHNRQSAGPT